MSNDPTTAQTLARHPRPAVGVRLSPNALRVLEKRYLLRDDRGRPVESPEELLWRVARHVALAERAYGADEARIVEAAEAFYRAMAALEFLPNSPALMNAGRPLGQCFACFVLPVADSLSTPDDDGIFDAVRAAADVHQTGGGTGFDFSRLRPEGATVSTTGGRASGPVSFMRVFNAATDAVRQGGFRRGANMGILRIDHPDILDFIELKATPGEMTHFNLSVAVTDEFLRELRGGLKHYVVDPRTGRKEVLRDKARDAEGALAGPGDREWTARELLDLIVRRAWETGEPGLFFVDRANRANPTPALGPIEATNPCGEQPLLPWEACTLGSINLARFVEAVGPLAAATSPESRVRWKALGDAVALGVRFLDDVIDASLYPRARVEEAVKGNRKIGLGVMGWADLLFQLGVPYDAPEALALARVLGRFIKEEAQRASRELAQARGSFPNWPASVWGRGPAAAPMRNACVTTVAPTGTLSILAGCSPGIEPLFSLAYTRQILDGERLHEVHPLFREIAEREGFASPELFDAAARDGSIRGLPQVPARWRAIFACAHDVPPEAHLRAQAAFQENVDSGVSKTVNLPASATPEDVRRVFELAIELDVKGVTVYRDGTRPAQPMALREDPDDEAALPDAVGRLVTLALARGASAAEVARAVGGAAPPPEACPECGGTLVYQEGCRACACGYGRCS
ncbi:MAG TPA: adenosylcobalamin-dependent ribonucleoside-diphosphate reductase [Planctomycetota bacterium]